MQKHGGEMHKQNVETIRMYNIKESITICKEFELYYSRPYLSTIM